MSLIKKQVLRDAAQISLSTLFLLFLLNIALVYYSPDIIRLLPPQFSQSISPCYRTFFHLRESSLEEVNFIFGDSYTEGAGDEFLSSDPDYGIFNKLKGEGSSALIFGRGGYGNIGTVVEFKKCFPLIAKYTSFNRSLIKRYHVTFVFYEGNDLNDNLIEKDRQPNDFGYELRFFLPIFEFVYKEGLRLLKSASREMFRKETVLRPVLTDEPVSGSGIKIELYPQAAAAELSDNEIEESVEYLFSSLDSVAMMLPDATHYMVLYLPSVATSYPLEGPIKVQSEAGREYFVTDAHRNEARSVLIRDTISRWSLHRSWSVCDTTPSLLNTSKAGLAVHGPLDWKRFNKRGYDLVAAKYVDCMNRAGF